MNAGVVTMRTMTSGIFQREASYLAPEWQEARDLYEVSLKFVLSDSRVHAGIVRRARLALRPLQRRSRATWTGPASRGGRCWRRWRPRPRACASGLMVAGNTYRHPAVHAHMAATVDVISNGRLDFGVGAGWNEYEHQSMGIPLYAPGERIRRLGEACEITKRLFTQQLTDFDGRYYQLDAGALRAEADPEAVSALRHRRQRRAAHPARRGAVRRRLELHGAADVEELPAQGARAARALRRRRPRSRARSSCRCRRGSTTTTSRRRSRRSSRSSRPAPPTSS